MKITRLKLSSIKPYEGNAKLHPEEQIKQIMRSIEEFGNNDPIAVDEDHVIIEGHGRYEALKRLGREDADCIVLSGMTEDQKNAYRLVHNKLTMNSDFDLTALYQELEKIDIDMTEFDFDATDEYDESEYERRKAEFEERMAAGELSEDDPEYQEFLEKFKPKKTTDDCYTPELIYEAVADYVSKRYKIGKDRFVRPFVPGGDYQSYQYHKNAAVVDNPPFSILSEIVEFYYKNNIKFFLFAPGLTPFSASVKSMALSICVGVNVTYENGADVCTSFVTNMEGGVFRSDPELYQIIKKANDENLKSIRKTMPRYSYPLSLITAANLNSFSKYGIYFSADFADCELIRQLDAQKESWKGIYGSGFLLSDEKTAEREKAEREKAERWELSQRELSIIERLSKK